LVAVESTALPSTGGEILNVDALDKTFSALSVAYAAEVEKADYNFEVIRQSHDLRLDADKLGSVWLVVKNIGEKAWAVDELFLKTSMEAGHESVMASYTWEDGQTIAPIKTAKEEINFGESVTFNFKFQAPSEVGLFTEHFNLLIGDERLPQDIFWKINVGGIDESAEPDKKIQIDIDAQRLYLLEKGYRIAGFPISSGGPGYATPRQGFRIMNHEATAYSKPYDLYMDNWMALEDLSGRYDGYGIHALPFWVLKGGGRLYEGASHLGTPVSHGCVRLGVDAAKLVYAWAENGTLVEIF